MRKLKVYLASPFFKEHEMPYVEEVEKILSEKGLNVWSPRKNQMEHLKEGTNEWSQATFVNDAKFVRACDIMVTIYHGNYSDSGTAFECGMAFGINMVNIVVHVGEDSNLMIHEGCHANLTLDELKDYDFDLLPSKRYEGKMF